MLAFFVLQLSTSLIALQEEVLTFFNVFMSFPLTFLTVLLFLWKFEIERYTEDEALLFLVVRGVVEPAMCGSQVTDHGHQVRICSGIFLWCKSTRRLIICHFRHRMTIAK